MKFRLIIFFITTVFLTACASKEEPTAYIGNAVFYANGEIDGNTFLMEAGNNNVLLESSFDTDSLNIKQFKSALKSNCTDCNEKLEITFRNFEIGNSNSLQVDSVFVKDKAYNFYKSILPPVGYKIVFSNQSKGTGNVSYKWDFGDGFVSSSSNPTFVFNSEGKKNISLKADYTDMGCSSGIENPVYINANKLNGYIDYDYVVLPSNVFRCTVRNADSSTHRYVWRYLNNSLNSFPVGNTFELPAFSNEGVYKVDLLAIDKTTNDTFTISKNIATKNNVSCNANFSYNIIPVRDSLQLKTIRVSYTNKQGEMFLSESIDQYGGFKIIETSNYTDAITNKKAFKIKVVFSCKASNGLRKIDLKNITAVIAYEY